MDLIEQILYYFPSEMRNFIITIIKQNNFEIQQLEEIRIRNSRPILLKFRKSDAILEYIPNSSEILQILERLCENSIYAYKEQLCNGFLTIKGGHRVGIVGTCVIEDGKVINVKYISSLNFRIAKEIKNCSTGILNEILDIKNQTIFNTLIVSPPGRGKTTMLRDLVRQISNGIPRIKFKGLTVGLVDERGEIAAVHKGIPQNDIGIRTDIIENVDKSTGINMLIRSMAPQVIACDEIGSSSDIQAIKRAIFSGVKGIFTMHGKDMEDIKNNKSIYRLIENKQLEKIIFI